MIWLKIIIKNNYSDSLCLFVYNFDVYYLEEVGFYEIYNG